MNRSMLVDTEKYLNSVLSTFLKMYFVGNELGLQNYPKYCFEKAVQKYEVRINITGNLKKVGNTESILERKTG